MGCTVFVKNLEAQVTEEHLWELFLQAGPLRRVSVPIDRESGRKRGFAYVTYRDECSVSYACELFDSIRLFKRPIYCQPSKDWKTTVNSSANQSTISDASPSPTRSRPSLDAFFGIDFPSASTPLHGKRKFGDDRVDNGHYNDFESSRDRCYNESKNTSRYDDERNRSRYEVSIDRDRRRYDGSGNRERVRSVGYRNDSRYDEPDRDRSPRRNNSNHNSSYSNGSHGNTSPMFLHAINQSFNQYGRQTGSPREDSSFKQPRRPRTNPY